MRSKGRAVWLQLEVESNERAVLLFPAPAMKAPEGATSIDGDRDDPEPRSLQTGPHR